MSGTQMKSPFPYFVADIFMESFEEVALQFSIHNLTFSSRCVDNSFITKPRDKDHNHFMK